MSIVTTLHDPNHAMLFSDKVIMMKKGTIVSIGPPREVITKMNMQKVYNVAVRLVENGQEPPIVLPETRQIMGVDKSCEIL